MFAMTSFQGSVCSVTSSPGFNSLSIPSLIYCSQFMLSRVRDVTSSSSFIPKFLYCIVYTFLWVTQY